MTPHHPTDDRLIDLVRGLLPARAAEETSAHLRDCVGCEERFRTFLRDREELRASPRPMLAGGRFELPQGSPDTAAAPAARPWWHRRRILAAGVVAAAVAALLVALPTKRFEPGTVYWMPDDFVGSVSRSGTGPGVDLEPVRRAYVARDASATLREVGRLDLSDASPAMAATATLYRASALLNTGRPRDALDALSTLEIELIPTRWRQEAMWMVYVGRDATDDPSGACDALRFLAAEEGGKAPAARSALAARECP